MITLKNFLKKYTAISNNFIDEYYSFYEKCEYNKFGIILDNVLDYHNNTYVLFRYRSVRFTEGAFGTHIYYNFV